ncbi:MAG: 3-deoxy-7-phosphoheptulonate synthase [Myxococcales bacterium]|nr:3-deoxy-7-phosphoheptulonate synthase [Myxococcales bacterium]MCB9644284.1 3-deoxy-7-phosphoheptulonate synthase [Myxococcales bacterium]
MCGRLWLISALLYDRTSVGIEEAGVIVQVDPKATVSQLDAIKDAIKAIDYKATEVRTQRGFYLVAIGKKDFDIRSIGHLEGVLDVHRVSDAYKLVSKKWKVGYSEIDLGDGVKVGGDELALMAGPCSIEGEEQIVQVLTHLKSQGVRVMRGGVFKPRTSPYSFQGTGMDGLKLWHQHAKALGIKIISEVMSVQDIGPMYDYIDIYQVGARNSQNFDLLRELGHVDKAVLIKRGMSGTIEDLLQSAEYVFSGGNERLMLCERGIRTYEQAYRNTLDINAVPLLKEKSHLPVIVDPSHGIGIRRFVEQVALAGVAAGGDGLIFEVHAVPEKAWSDGQQTLNFAESKRLIHKARRLFSFCRALEGEFPLDEEPA